MERHHSVRNRLAAWDKYRLDQSKLMNWLKDIERERNKLQLRFIHLRRLDNIVQRIQLLLDKVPSGESQVESLQAQQDFLLKNCDEALAVSVRMEHAANVQRLANIRASLETWRGFVMRIKELNSKHSEQSAKVSAKLQQVSKVVSEAFHSGNGSVSLSQTKKQLDSLQQLKSTLMECSSDLESLGVITEQLKECLSPSDMKSLNQHSTLLWQQHGDLEHQLALLAFKLGERCSLHSRWENRLGRLLIWIKDTETRFHNCDSIISLEEPEEALKRLECELLAEMVPKRKELDWLQNTGKELAAAAEEMDRRKMKEALEEVLVRWQKLESMGKARTNKLMELMRVTGTLERRLSETKVWLAKVESRLIEPFSIESMNENLMDDKLKDHERLQGEISAQRSNVADLLSQCEDLLSECETWKVSFGIDMIKSGMETVDRRWRNVCNRAEEKRTKMALVWRQLQELQDMRQRNDEWLVSMEKELSNLEGSVKNLTIDESKKALETAEKLFQDIETRRGDLDKVEMCYGRLAKIGLDLDNLRLLTVNVRQVIDRWHALTTRLNTILKALRQDNTTYREFITAHGAAVIGLTQVDILLTQAQHLTSNQNLAPKDKLQQLADIEEELSTQNVTLQQADELALKVMQESHPEDVGPVQQLVDEYQLLWKDIRARVSSLRKEIEVSGDKDVDEAVQVETLRFEQDTAVQVDTLPKMTRMTSVDAYAIELTAAVNECRDSLDALEVAIAPEPSTETDLVNTGKNIVSLKLKKN